jgi:hypothetical protein
MDRCHVILGRVISRAYNALSVGCCDSCGRRSVHDRSFGADFQPALLGKPNDSVNNAAGQFNYGGKKSD